MKARKVDIHLIVNTDIPIDKLRKAICRMQTKESCVFELVEEIKVDIIKTTKEKNVKSRTN